MGKELGGHIRTTCESGSLTQLLLPRVLVWSFVFGNINPHLSVSVSSQLDVPTIKVIAEDDDNCCPWSICQVHLGDTTTYRNSFEWEGRTRGKGEEPRERSREENRKREEWLSNKGKWRIYQNVNVVAILLPDVEERVGIVVLSTATAI
jgi:hypothetical protein